MGLAWDDDNGILEDFASKKVCYNLQRLRRFVLTPV